MTLTPSVPVPTDSSSSECWRLHRSGDPCHGLNGGRKAQVHTLEPMTVAVFGKGSLQACSSEGSQTDHPGACGGLKPNDWCPTETPRDARAETGETRPQAREHLAPRELG